MGTAPGTRGVEPFNIFSARRRQFSPRSSLVWKTVLSGTSTNGFETDLGARVRALRRARGLTLKGLGRLAGLSHPFLSHVDRGLPRPSIGSVERIAAALDVSVAHLWAPTREPDAVQLLRADEGEILEEGLRSLGGAPALREGTAPPRRWPDQPWVRSG